MYDHIDDDMLTREELEALAIARANAWAGAWELARVRSREEAARTADLR